MRVIFMGTPDFAVKAFEAILEAGHEIVLAVTQPDKPKGRGNHLGSSPIKDAAIARNIPLFQPKKVREEAAIDYLRTFNCDIIIVAAFGQILPKAILDMPPFGCVNIHASLLPKYRGAAPIQWAVINGDLISGVTTMRMAQGIDTGDMILKKEISLDKEETGGSLFDKLRDLGASLCVETMKAIEEETATYTQQIDEEATHVGMIAKSFGRIDWNKSAIEIERLVRGLDPWPCAFTRFNEKTLKIWKSKVVKQQDEHTGKPGEIIAVSKNELLIQTGEDLLSIEEVQLEGKKRMDVTTFLRGNAMEKGWVLGGVKL